MFLKREQILSVAVRLHEVDIPEWGGTVYIRPITLAEQGKLADLGVQYENAKLIEKMRRITMALVIWVVVDASGQPMFGTDDIDALMGTPASAVARLQDEILKVSGLTAESRAELEKNLPVVANAGADSL